MVVDTLKEYFYDLILLDISMPTLTGDKLCKQIKNIFSTDKLKIVFVCVAYALPREKQRFVSIGFNDLLIKPINIEILKKKLKKFNFPD